MMIILKMVGVAVAGFVGSGIAVLLGASENAGLFGASICIGLYLVTLLDER